MIKPLVLCPTCAITPKFSPPDIYLFVCLALHHHFKYNQITTTKKKNVLNSLKKNNPSKIREAHQHSTTKKQHLRRSSHTPPTQNRTRKVNISSISNTPPRIGTFQHNLHTSAALPSTTKKKKQKNEDL
eukprot:gene8760-6162_t